MKTIDEALAEIEARHERGPIHTSHCICVECENLRTNVPRLCAAVRAQNKRLNSLSCLGAVAAAVVSDSEREVAAILAGEDEGRASERETI